MKKLLVFLAALLPCVPGFSREFTLVTRAEISTLEDSRFANSSIYAFLDGEFTENLSYSVSTHLLSTYAAELYTYSWRSDSCNWLDWANVTYSAGPFDFTIGKDVLKIGNFEFQNNDCDCYYELASMNWLTTSSVCPTALPNIYLWGGSVTANMGERAFATFQLSSSPYNVRPFGDKLFAYSLQIGEFAPEDSWLSALASFNFVQTASDNFKKLFYAGIQTSFDPLTLSLDGSSSLGEDSNASLTFNGSYVFNEKLTLGAAIGYEAGFYAPRTDRKHCGLLLNWFPIECLRAHALASYDSLFDTVFFNIGLTWKLTL